NPEPTRSAMKILSPAKINLFLHICGKRPDGYHELFSLMCRITLFDELSLQIGRGKTIEIDCTHPDVPADDTNLAHRAASLFQSKLNSTHGVNIHLNKKIPVAAGLGGGSSNAASVLMALNTYYDRPFNRQQLMEMGLGLGADVPFFIFQRPAIASGIGEQLEAFEGCLPYHILLLYQGFNVSTAETYQKLNFGLTNDKKKPTSNSLKRDRFKPARHLTNDLERVTVAKYPEIGLAKEKILNLGAIGALMSGSGPTVFGLFDNAETARSAKKTLAADKDLKLFLVDPILEADPI
ncbi:MAG: 4-(cytidine 5'-diphospho)-2-C-methyl-D-erythritol kinase, partial [Desulfobacterales bacterium]